MCIILNMINVVYRKCSTHSSFAVHNICCVPQETKHQFQIYLKSGLDCSGQYSTTLIWPCDLCFKLDVSIEHWKEERQVAIKNNKIRDVNTWSLCNTYALSVPRLCSTTRWHDTRTCTNTRFLCSGNNRLILSYRRVVLPSIAMFPIIIEFSDRSIVCIVSFHQKASTDLIVILQTNRPQWWRHEFMMNISRNKTQ